MESQAVSCTFQKGRRILEEVFDGREESLLCLNLDGDSKEGHMLLFGAV